MEQLAERLPTKTAVILLLMDVLDFKAKETAEYVRMKEATVQVTLGCARSRLKQLAQDTEPAAGSNRVNGYPHDFDALVDAFRRRDPEQIYRAYIGLNKEGIRLTQLQAVDGRLYFAFRDPDGNLFRVVSK